MLGWVYKHERFMEESERCVEATARSGRPEDRSLATGILEQPVAYRRWLSEHDRLIRGVSEQGKLERQLHALRRSTFGLIHRKALFGYLRDQHVVGLRRQHLFALFYGTRDYVGSVVAEHGNYLRSESSYLCTRFLAEELMHDGAMHAPLLLYEEWYADYFRVFCDTALAETPEEKEHATALLALQPLLKHRLNEARQAILESPSGTSGPWREWQIRQPTGDTVRLRLAFGPR
ncbi:MAG TPA: hypothetical protein VFX20_09435 [Steroidobacteraceae bacterium]|nr:hypothetical protein [Steroidobacteraceae bacterium]